MTKPELWRAQLRLVSKRSQINTLDVTSLRHGPHLIRVAEERIHRKRTEIDFHHKVCLPRLNDMDFDLLWQGNIVLIVVLELYRVGVCDQLITLIVD